MQLVKTKMKAGVCVRGKKRWEEQEEASRMGYA